MNNLLKILNSDESSNPERDIVETTLDSNTLYEDSRIILIPVLNAVTNGLRCPYFGRRYDLSDGTTLLDQHWNLGDRCLASEKDGVTFKIQCPFYLSDRRSRCNYKHNK